MWFGIITIFPEMFNAIKHYGINRRSIEKNLVQLNLYNPRDYTTDKHANIDDKPYGGGPGMVMKVEPLFKAIVAAKRDSKAFKKIKVINLSPQGKRITQKDLREFIEQQEGAILVCGRYEGVDERICELAVDEEWSIGDFVLSGGEVAAMAVLDAVIRLLPGALGDPDSFQEDSFGEDQLLDYPNYTRPQSIYGLSVPEVLLSGNHSVIANWRQQQRLVRTASRRKDLLGEQEYEN
jgi:tRNA (guanine37-N1)-methyltransferase